MLLHNYKFSYENTKYDITLNSKFTILQGDSATGKSNLITAIKYYKERRDSEFYELFKNFHTDIVLDNAIDFRKINNEYSENDIIVIDEDVTTKIVKASIYEELNHVKCFCILIFRPQIMQLHVSYKDYKCLRLVNGINVLEQIYPNYDTFMESSDYVTKDEKSAFLYFNTRLNSVISAKGKEKLVSIAEKLNDVTVIADGAALSYEFPRLYDLGCKMFLPDSFEALVIEYFKPEVVVNKFENCPISMQNYERYFDQIINTLGLPFYYRKGTLAAEIFEADLIDGLSTIIRQPDNLEYDSLIRYQRRCELTKRKVYQNTKLIIKDVELLNILFKALEDSLDVENFDESYKSITSSVIKKYYRDNYISNCGGLMGWKLEKQL